MGPKQPGALSAPELLKNKCNSVRTLKRKAFPSRSCCLGCLAFFIKTTSLSCFPLISMMSLMGNLSAGTMTDGCSWKIKKELNLEWGDSCLLPWLYQGLKYFSFHHTFLFRHCKIWESCGFTFPTWKCLWPDTAPRDIQTFWVSESHPVVPLQPRAIPSRVG